MNRIISILLSLISLNAMSQLAATDSKGKVTQVQPSVMVIPRVNEGQDIRSILDQNEPLRAVVTKMKEKFDERQFRTYSFEAALKAALANKVFTSENQTDMKTILLQMSNPDIYVELDVSQVSCSGASIARVNMNAYYTATGLSIGSVVAESHCNVAEFGRLAEQAINTNADKFMNTMQTNFDDLVQHGVPILINIDFAQGSEYSMSSTISSHNDDELSDVIGEWMENAAFENQYNPPIFTDKLMVISDLRVPLRDQVTGKNYNPQKFAKSFQDFLKNIGIPNKKYVKTGGIFITIQ